MAWGLVQADRVSFAAIGRQVESASFPASQITRVFKFCHNELVDPAIVQETLVKHLAGRAEAAVRGVKLVTVALDWHAYDNGRINALRLSLMTGTRALPLLWYEIETAKLGGRMGEMEQQAIRDLIRYRPPGITWLILLDSGFRSPDLIRLLDQAGYYVMRSATSTLFHTEESCWARVGDLPVEVGEVVEFGWGYLSKQNPLRVRLVGARIYDVKPPKPARRRSTTHHYKYSKPGLCIVITNLSIEIFPASIVIRLYSRRFEIEHNFRDLKNASLGMDMEHVHLRHADTYARLMCIVAVAESVLWLVGMEAEAQGLQLRFTPSQPRDGRRVLSLRRLGRLCLDRIEGSVEELLEKHLRPAITGIIDVVGRTWKDARRQGRLESAVLRASDLKRLKRNCDTRGKRRLLRCKEQRQLHVISENVVPAVALPMKLAA